MTLPTDGWLPLAVATTLVVLAAAVACAVCVGLVGVRRAQARTQRELAEARAEAARLREQLADLEHRVAAPVARQEYVITDLGSHPVPAAPERRGDAVPAVEPRLFADIVLRESTVRAASFVHGVRRALAPETRNRIRFEMRREVKRSRKQRRAEMKAVHREWLARQRAGLDRTDPDRQEGSAA